MTRPVTAMHRRRRARSTRRRGLALVTTLVIGISALLLASSLLVTLESESVAEAARRRSSALRLAALSGADVVMHALSAGRDSILNGGLPAVESSFVIAEDGAQVFRVRLLPLPGGAASDAGRVIRPENAGLDLNLASADDLAATGLVTTELAEAIVAHRARVGHFADVDELLVVPGMTDAILLGDDDPPDFRRQAGGAEADLRDRLRERLGAGGASGLAEVVTVFSAAPQLQRSGVRRIGLGGSWSDELGRRLDERFGEGSGRVVQSLMEQGIALGSDRDIAAVLLRFNLPLERWAETLDALAGDDTLVRFGRIDINHAPIEALRGAGFTEEEATAVVQARSALSADERWSPVWLRARGIIDGERYVDLCDRVTTRSWIHRVRIAAYVTSVDDESVILPGGGPLVFDLVVDLVDPSPRVALLREVTWDPLARALTAMRMPGGDPRRADAAEDARMTGWDDDPGSDDAEPSIDPPASAPSDGSRPPAAPGRDQRLSPPPGPAPRLPDRPGPARPLDPAGGRTPVPADAAPPADGSDAAPGPAPGSGGPGGRRLGRWIAILSRPDDPRFDTV